VKIKLLLDYGANPLVEVIAIDSKTKEFKFKRNKNKPNKALQVALRV